MPEGLTDAQARETAQIAELETRRYFDQYLANVWPQQEAAMREHIASLVQAHDDSENAHGGVERKFNRIIWVLTGAACVGGAGGAGLTRLLILAGGG